MIDFSEVSEEVREGLVVWLIHLVEDFEDELAEVGASLLTNRLRHVLKNLLIVRHGHEIRNISESGRKGDAQGSTEEFNLSSSICVVKALHRKGGEGRCVSLSSY